jgi:hypothetical protein
VEVFPRIKVTNPRVFHLVQKSDNAGNDKGISNSALPRHESPIIMGMSRVHEGITFPLGEIAVVANLQDINSLAEATYSNVSMTLNGNIRLCCQYSVTQNGRIIHLHADPQEQIKHYLADETLKIMDMTYLTDENYFKYGDAPARRKNGNLALVHPKQVMAGVAAIEAPLAEGDKLSLAPVVEAGFHDVFEDVADPSQAMRNVKFRAMKGSYQIETQNIDLIKEHLIRLYSEYNEYVAKKIVKDLSLLTRKEIPKGMTKNDYYIHYYLRGLYREISCAKVKAEDFHSNAMAISDIGDKAEMMRLAWSLIPKGISQVLAWKKDAWVEYYRLLARLDDLLLLFKDEKEYAGIGEEIRAPSKADLENFEIGVRHEGSRRFSYPLMARMELSGSPVLTHYKTTRDGKLISEIETPFCRNTNQAIDIVQHGFHDVRDIDVKRAPNLIQKRLGSGMIVQFEAKEKWDIVKRMHACRKQYDKMLCEGQMGPAFIGFDRHRYSEAAKEKWGPVLARGSQRLEPFKFYKMQVR